MQRFAAYIGEDTARSLQGVVSMLNEGNPEHPLYAQSRANLVQLIENWQVAQRSTLRDPFEIEVDAPKPRLLKMRLPAGAPNLLEIQKNLKVTLSPAGPGASYTIDYNPGRKWTAWDLAYQQFVRLVTNPECEKFGGPCPRCEKYFVRKTAKPSVYCSRRCASQDTAVKRTVEVRKQQHENKLRVAKQAIAKWENLSIQRRAKQGWKEYVAGYHPGAEITTKFLTRAVNEGTLQAPSISQPRKERTHETTK
jgi:hypothetical protein